MNAEDTTPAAGSPVERPVVQPGPARCECHACIAEHDLRGPGGWPLAMTQMVVCPTCGNKRCPHATDHRNACTGSNDAGQRGSLYGGCCDYPNCRCPFDAPADQNWCAKGLPHAPRKTPNVRAEPAPTAPLEQR